MQLSVSLNNTTKSHRVRLTDEHTSVSSNILSSPKPPLELCLSEVIREGSNRHKGHVTVEEPPIPFSPFSLADCTMLNHFSFNDFIAIAFPDLAGDLDVQI